MANGVEIVLFLLASLATVGLAIFYNRIQKEGMILYWWYKLLKEKIPEIYEGCVYGIKHTFVHERHKNGKIKHESLIGTLIDYAFTGNILEAWEKKYKHRINLWPLNLLWNVIVFIVWYTLFAPTLIILVSSFFLFGLIITIPLHWLRKPLALCIHCNIFWLSALVYWSLYGLNLYFFAFFGITYFILNMVLRWGGLITTKVKYFKSLEFDERK